MRPVRLGRLSLRDFFRVLNASALACIVVIAVPTALSLALSEASYAGASDEKIADMVTTTYRALLLRVGALGFLALVAVLVLSTLVTTGLALLRETRHLRDPARRTRTAVGCAVLAVSVVWGWGAREHSGLFLEALSGSALLRVFVESCAVLAPATLTAAVIGFGWGTIRGTLGVRVLLSIGFVAVSAAAGRTRREMRDARPRMFAAPDPDFIAKVDKGHPIPKTNKPPNVLWIAVDSLRPDKIDRKTTPNLAAILDGAIVWDDAVVPVPRTGPSWVSALTSTMPLTNGIETMFPDRARGALMDISLPGELADQGYRTMVTSEYAGEFFGRVDLGFQIRSVPRAELAEISSQALLARMPIALSAIGLAYGYDTYARAHLPPELVALVRGMPNFAHPRVLEDDVTAMIDDPTNKGRPWFVLAFYSQPHFPYTSSRPFTRTLRVAGSSGDLAYGRDVTNAQALTSDADKRQLDRLYRAALAESDAAIGSLVAKLRARGQWDDTIVVVTADHGEGLYECDTCVGHGDNLRGMQTLRVPLAIRLPRARFPAAQPGHVGGWASTLDIYPTLVEVMGLPPVATLEGVSLLTRAGQALPIAPRWLFAETGAWLWATAAVPKDRIAYPPITESAHLDGDRIAIDTKFDGVIRAAKHRAAIRAPYKLLYEPTKDGVRYRLFDFTVDPFDDHDLAAEKPEVLAEMKEALRREVLRHPSVLAVGDYFLTAPPPPSEDQW